MKTEVIYQRGALIPQPEVRGPAEFTLTATLTQEEAFALRCFAGGETVVTQDACRRPLEDACQISSARLPVASGVAVYAVLRQLVGAIHAEYVRRLES